MTTENNFLIYKSDSGEVSVNVHMQDETVWLTQKQLAELFGTTKQNVGQHVKNILDEGELSADSVVKKFFTTASDGKEYNTEH
jgi:hypothetical protein